MLPLFAVTTAEFGPSWSHLDYCMASYLFSYYQAFCFLPISHTNTRIHFEVKRSPFHFVTYTLWWLLSFRIKSTVLSVLYKALSDLISVSVFYFACSYCNCFESCPFSLPLTQLATFSSFF